MRLGASCALFALAMQFALSFGHVHPEIDWSAGELGLSALRSDGSSAAIQAPAAPIKPPGTASDYCAICAIANLAGIAMPAPALALPVPTAIDPLGFWPRTDANLAATPHRPFQARAPPVG